MVASVSRPRSSRVGPVAALGVVLVLISAYLGNCFTGLGLPGPGPGAPAAKDSAARKTEEKAAGERAAPARLVVQGEQCRLGDDPTLRSCDAACAEVPGGRAEVDATAGAQRTVEALRTCLQGRKVKVQVLSE